MNENLQKLINKIELEDKYYQFFDNAKLERIISNKEKTNYTFIISVQNTLPVELYKHFIEKLKAAYCDIEKVIVAFNVLNQNNALIPEYFKYLMIRASTKCPVLETFADNNIVLENRKLIIDVDNIAEQNKLFSLEKILYLILNEWVMTLIV